MMKKIGLISCVSKKKKGKHRAEELYTSPLFVLSCTYVKKHYDEWFILSAKHHLLSFNKVIESYNETLVGKASKIKKIWAEKTFQQIRETIKPDKATLFVHAGLSYRKYLMPLLQTAGYKVEVPLVGLRIGEQLSWYNKHAKYE